MNWWVSWAGKRVDYPRFCIGSPATEDYLPSRLGSTPAGDLTRSFFWGLKGELWLSIVKEMGFATLRTFLPFFLALLFCVRKWPFRSVFGDCWFFAVRSLVTERLKFQHQTQSPLSIWPPTFNKPFRAGSFKGLQTAHHTIISSYFRGGKSSLVALHVHYCV